MASRSNSTFEARTKLTLSCRTTSLRPFDTNPQRCWAERFRNSCTKLYGLRWAAPVAPGVRRSTSNLNETKCTGTWLCHWWLTGYGLPSISRLRLFAWSQPYPSSRKTGKSHLSRVSVVPWSKAGTFREASRNAFQLPTQVFHARAAASFSRSPAFRWYESGVSPGRLGSPSTMRASRSTGSSRPEVWTVVKGFRTRVRTSSAPHLTLARRGWLLSPFQGSEEASWSRRRWSWGWRPGLLTVAPSGLLGSLLSPLADKRRGRGCRPAVEVRWFLSSPGAGWPVEPACGRRATPCPAGRP